MGDILYIVVPCYNEEEVLETTSKVLYEKIKSLIDAEKISEKSKIVFVNDGSRDATWSIISKLHEENKAFVGVNLSCNRGHQNALLAGLLTVKDYADMTISIDADLQDDVDAIDEMVDKYNKGCDVVFGVRSKRKTDTFFKRFTAETFYKTMDLLGAKTVFNHADYRLLSSRALDALSHYREVNLFLRGLVPMVGYKSDVVLYERKERFAGESKYPLSKMLSFAMEGITSLSVKPLRMITALGFIVFSISLLMLIYIFVRFFMGETVEGWSSMAVSIWAIGGLILLSLGIVGEYIGKIYLEVKDRPKFIVEDFLHENDKNT